MEDKRISAGRPRRGLVEVSGGEDAHTAVAVIYSLPAENERLSLVSKGDTSFAKERNSAPRAHELAIHYALKRYYQSLMARHRSD